MDRYQQLIIALLIIAFLASCSKSSEGISEKEQRLIDDYHAQIKQAKGRKYLFIPKNEASIIFRDKGEVLVGEAKPGDKVIFLDKEQNVVYQAKVVKNNDHELPVISCLNLDTFQYYRTSLQIDQLRGYDKELIKTFKILR